MSSATLPGKLRPLVRAMPRVHDLARRAAKDVGADERNAIATELASLRDQLVAMADAEHEGRRSGHDLRSTIDQLVADLRTGDQAGISVSIEALRRELAETQDLDVDEAIMELRVQEVAYEATVGALGRSLPTSLVAFLH